MINVLCVYSLKSVHVFFSWSSQRWFRISDSFFPRMFVGTCLTSPGSSPQKIYKPLKENTHHKSFLAVISWKNVDMFLFVFLLPTKLSCFFCLVPFLHLFGSHPVQIWKDFSTHFAPSKSDFSFPTNRGGKGLQGAMMQARLDTQYYLQGIFFLEQKSHGELRERWV